MPGYGNAYGAMPPHGRWLSPCPPVIDSIVTEICMRGPGSTPSSTARFMPQSAPPASRTVVMPIARYQRSVSGNWKKRYEKGVYASRTSSKSS